MTQRTISIKFSDHMLAELEAAAARAGVTRHAFVKRAVVAALRPVEAAQREDADETASSRVRRRRLANSP